MNYYKFTSLREGAGVGTYFTIRDSIHQEYAKGQLFSISKVDWLSGNRVNVIFKYVTVDVKDGFFVPGDTMKLEIVSLDKDTLSLRVNFKDYPTSSVFRYLRSPLEK